MKNRDIINKRLIKPEEFLWKRFSPSIQTFSFLNKFFTSLYIDFSSLINIKSIEWNKDRFNITLIDRSSWETLYISIKDNLWIKKCLGVLCTNNICIWIHDIIKNEVFLKFLVHFSVKWKNIEFSDFLNILTKDLKAKKEYYQIFWKTERPPFSIIQDWWYELHKFRFLVHEWVMRNIDQSISLNLTEASIHHSERECQWISPNNKSTWYHFFNFPWWFYQHNFDKYYYLTNEEKKIFLASNDDNRWIWISTDLNEEDIVMWKWTDKLSDAINYVIDNIEKNNIKVISFNCCCVPRIVWDDIYSVLKKAKEKIKIPLIFQGQLEKTPYEQKVMLLEEYMNKVNTEKIEKIKDSISLFGYHENKYQKDLWDILSENWIKINASFIPSIDVRLLPIVYKSELFIFSPNNFQKEVFESPFQSLWIEYIIPKYPYSFKYTEKWIKAILKEFDKEYRETLSMKELRKSYEAYINYVKDKWFRIWVIFIWKKELEKFLNPDYMDNIDIVNSLEEMWFELNFYIYDDFKWQYFSDNDNSYTLADWNHDDIISIIRKKSENIKYSFFSDDEWFENIFKTNKLDIIYSDLYFDDRIIKLWLNQFNLKNFHVWYEWAIKTIKELINLCKMTFYKNYKQYFYD